jgi:tight adherence protein B
MRPVDIVTLGAFFALLVAALIVRSLRQIARQQPGTRIRTRVAGLRDEQQSVTSRRGDKDGRDKQQELLQRKRRLPDQAQLLAPFVAKYERVRTVGGSGGIRLVCIVAIVAMVASFIGTASFSFGPFARFMISIGVMLLAVRAAYRWIMGRFRLRFLAAFPDTLDLIIRAVRAGIPAVQAICIAGIESEEPVRTTFRTMGDALLVGAELKEVLEQAAARLQLADFSFFTVCLILQRETGGNLGDTLETLAAIVRSRRDIRAKSKALTAEGKLASKMIAAVPFVIMGVFYVVNRPYLDTLTNTHAGHKILALAAGLMTVGLWLINKIANLDTSR